MSEGDVKKGTRPSRVLRALFMLIHVAHGPCTLIVFGMAINAFEGWKLAFVMVSWVLYALNGAFTSIARHQQQERRETQMNASAEFLSVGPNVTLNEDQARRIFEIFKEGQTQGKGLN